MPLTLHMLYILFENSIYKKLCQKPDGDVSLFATRFIYIYTQTCSANYKV